MADFGDIYSYRIDVSADTSGAVAATQATQAYAAATEMATAVTQAQTVAATAATAATTRQASATRQAAAAAQAAAGSGYNGGAGGRFGGTGFAGLANALAGVAVLADDLQYGSRNIANNLIFLGSVAPHPALKTLGVTAGLLTSIFHKQIDAALGLGMAYQKDTEAAKQFELSLSGVDTKLSSLLTSVQMASQGGQGKPGKSIVDAILGDSDYLRNELENAKRELTEAMTAKPVDLVGLDPMGTGAGGRVVEGTRKNAAAISAATAKVAEIQKQQSERAIADWNKQIEAASRSEEGLQDLVQRLRQLGEAQGNAGMLDMADALERQSEAFAKMDAKAHRFVAGQREQVKVQKDLDEWTKKAQRNNEELIRQEEELIRKRERKVELLRQEAQAEAQIREMKQEEMAGVQANAFRDMIGGDMQMIMRNAVAGGATQDQAQRMAFERAFAFLRRSGLNDVNAANTAAKLAEEQGAAMQQMIANMDAMLGAMVGMQRQNTWARRMAALQANQIRQMTLRNQPGWGNNRPGWP